MNIFKMKFIIQAPVAYLVLLVSITLLFGILLYNTDPNSDARYIGILSGLVTGIGIAVLQFFTQYIEQKTLSEFKEHGLVKILINRKDPEYYRKLIKKTKVGDKIIVAGVTCNRLLDDFANPDLASSQDLLEALARGVEVTLLLPKLKYLREPDYSDFKNKTLPKSQQITASFPDIFKIRYHDFEPSHSIFLAGASCLVGPIFKNKKSKDTPAINFDREGLFAKPYLAYIYETLNNASVDYE